MKEILKLFGREGRLAKWAAEIRTYDISYIQRKEVEGSVVKKFFGQGEQVQKTPDANEGEMYNLSKKLQAKLTSTPRAWRLYLGKEAIEEGSSVGIILVSPDEKMHSYAIRLKFNSSDHAMDCEALLAELVASVSKGKEVQGRNYGCNSPIPQVPYHASFKNLELQNRSVNGVGNNKAGIPQPRSFGGNQDKTIG
ncbi:hypothetical protein Tco_0875568 [Tanacetum coccineum]|uniref:Uncharacterized protein n=1 Tax=Tanacetum coccineum TaxID=301880 RepID=A0ABQ5BSP0_9ASTR